MTLNISRLSLHVLRRARAEPSRHSALMSRKSRPSLSKIFFRASKCHPTSCPKAVIAFATKTWLTGRDTKMSRGEVQGTCEEHLPGAQYQDSSWTSLSQGTA